MAWALKFTAGSGYAQNTTAMVKPTGDAYLEIDVKFDNIVSGMTTYLAWVGGSAGSQRVYLSVNFNDNIGFAGRGSMVSSNSYKAVTGERHTLKIAFESGEWVGYFDGVEVGRYTNSMSDIQNGGFNFAVNPALTIGNDDFSIVTAKWVDVNTPANNRTYSADASDRSGTTDQPTLTETISAHNAVGTDFPSFDSSVWVDLGGGGAINASGALTIPAPTVNGSLTKVAPTFSVSGSVVIASPIVSGTAGNTAPQFDLSGSLTIPAPLVSGSASNTVPQFDSIASVIVPAPIVSGGLDKTNPQFNASGNLTIPAPLVSGSLSNGVSVISASGNITIASPAISGSLDNSAPQFNASASVTMPAPTVSGGINPSLPFVNASGAITIASPTANGMLDKTKPVYLASGSITIPSPLVSGALLNGVIDVTFNSKTNYNQIYLSSDFSQTNQYTGYNQPFKSTNRNQ